MNVKVDFRNGRVTLVGGNPSGPNPAIAMTNEQAVSLAKTILVKLDKETLREKD